MMLWIACLLVLSLAPANTWAQSPQVPHVSECNYCSKCLLQVGEVDAAAVAELARRHILQQVKEQLHNHAVQRSSEELLQHVLELDVEVPASAAGAHSTQDAAPTDATVPSEQQPLQRKEWSSARQQWGAHPAPAPLQAAGQPADVRTQQQQQQLSRPRSSGPSDAQASAYRPLADAGGLPLGDLFDDDAGDEEPLALDGRALRQQARPPPGQKDWDFNTTIAPMRAHIRAKAKKQNCTECYGCTADIQPLKGQSAFGRNFSIEQGASQEWLFTTKIPRTGKPAIIKVWCVPFDKQRKTFRWMCSNTREAARATNFLLAQQRVMEECGLMDVTIRLWMAPVNAIIPGFDFHIWWDGLWMEQAPGISLNQMAYLTKQQMRRGNLLELLQNKLNKTQVVQAAMYDLLTSQCDRHSQNVFLSETGGMTLIDNLQALKYNWLKCSVDSIFLPGTTKNEVIRFGGDLVSKRKGARARRSLNPMLLLDYRCYVEGGLIGTKYPPQLTQCLDRIRGMTPAAVQLRYRFPDLRMAEILHARAEGMATLGFEHTLKYGLPLNPNPKRYRWQPPCCEMHINTRGILECAHEWTAVAEFPVGDPLGGGPWTKPYPDIGTYDGGTV